LHFAFVEDSYVNVIVMDNIKLCKSKRWEQADC